jgi:squalene synthase HpnC
MSIGVRANVSAPAADDVLAKARRENFPVALFVLPRGIRRHLRAVYGFARLVDDAGDEAAGDRDALLDAIERDLDRAFSRSPSNTVLLGENGPRHPLMATLADSIYELGLPREPFERLIEANRQDQRVSRYETYRELEHYCELSANPVGRLVLYVFGRPTTERIAWSDSVCTGLQLAEHWQDVGEDYRRGRIYVPQEDLQRFGVEERALGNLRVSPALRELMAFEVERARRLLEAGVPLASSLRGRERLAIAGYVGGGHAALDAVERSGYEVLGNPPKAGKALRARRILEVLRES